jgi:hypothetical protein
MIYVERATLSAFYFFFLILFSIHRISQLQTTEQNKNLVMKKEKHEQIN